MKRIILRFNLYSVLCHLSFASFNMHGLNQGRTTLDYLCSESELYVDIIFLQEHWQTPNNLDNIKHFSTLYNGYGISAMESAVSNFVLKGRPWGGVCTLIKSTLGCKIKFTKCAERYAAIVLDNFLFINVYFPSIVNDSDLCTVQAIIAEIDDIVSMFPRLKIIFAGDFNTDISKVTAKSNVFSNFIDKMKVVACNCLIDSNLNFTYCHDSLQHFSYIDFICVSRSITADLDEFKVLELPFNLSDHCPIYARIAIDQPLQGKVHDKHDAVKQCTQRNLRWDHAALPVYYNCTRELLQPLFDELSSVYNEWMSSAIACCDRTDECYCVTGQCDRPYVPKLSSEMLPQCNDNIIENMHDRVVRSLREAADYCIPAVQSNFFKYWWSQELNELKSNSCLTHSNWIGAGRPTHGPIYEAKRVAKSNYKKCIKDNQKLEKQCVSNSLHDALATKSSKEFWKTWQSKFGKKNVSPLSVEGLNDNQAMADGFAKYFYDVSNSASSLDNQKLSFEFKTRLASYKSTFNDDKIHINIELIDSIIKQLDKCKAAGVDQLTAEHFQFAHPIVINILSMLLNLMIRYEYVPDAFGIGILVPIPKKDTNCNFDKFSDYRGITISPVISKIFELCIVNNLNDLLKTCDLQFGFKSGIGCNHAINTVRSTVNYFTSKGSTVNLCALDVNKAFDRVNHFVLFNKLMDRNIPRNFISLLSKWYGKIFATVKWKSCESPTFQIFSGVRQGGVLSPLLFAIFVDNILVKLKLSGLGCRIHGVFINAIMYADDLLLLSISVSDLHSMVNICTQEFRDIGLSINIKKSACMRIGPRFKVRTPNLSIENSTIEWKAELKYLGVSLLAANSFKRNLQTVRQKFFRALNGIFGKIGTNSSTAVTLSLINSFCTPLLTYAMEALDITKSMYNVLESAYSSAFSKLFGSFDKNIIRYCQFYFNMLPLCDVIDCRRLNFLYGMKRSNNYTLKFIFEFSGNAELRVLLKKHDLPSENFSPNLWRTVLKSNFAKSLSC